MLNNQEATVDCSSLENWRPFTGTVGSNPTLSATLPTCSDRQGIPQPRA
jgi:hypothetical protein